MVDVATQFAMLTHAVRDLNPHLAPITPDGGYETDCGQFDVWMLIPLHGIVEARLTGIPILGMELNFGLTASPVPGAEYTEFQGANLPDMMSGFLSLIFANFYEENLPFIQKRLSTDSQAWPDIINFARIVRNAAFHGGFANFQNPKSSSARWHHLEIGPQNNGYRIIGRNRLFCGDLILLLRDFSEHLDALGVDKPHL